MKFKVGDKLSWLGLSCKVVEVDTKVYGNPNMGNYEIYKIRFDFDLSDQNLIDGEEFWIREGEAKLFEEKK